MNFLQLCKRGAALVAAALALAAGSAQAREVNWSVGLSAPGVVVGVNQGYPYPVVVAPAPMYAPPPRPRYHAPAPVYYQAPPPAYYYGPPPHAYRHPHHHHRHGWDDRPHGRGHGHGHDRGHGRGHWDR